MLAGWDWASQSHDVTVIDDFGKVVDRWSLRHCETDFEAALERLARGMNQDSCRSQLNDPGNPFAAEMPEETLRK